MLRDLDSLIPGPQEVNFHRNCDGVFIHNADLYDYLKEKYNIELELLQENNDGINDDRN